MSKAFVLINAESGYNQSVWENIREIKEIKEANTVYGLYDIIARVEAANTQELKNVISLQIRKIIGIHSTLTIIVTEDSQN